ncbi:hypothetical protein AHAS_Ahas19G0059700 [Arachis hypogaea]
MAYEEDLLKPLNIQEAPNIFKRGTGTGKETHQHGGELSTRRELRNRILLTHHRTRIKSPRKKKINPGSLENTAITPLFEYLLWRFTMKYAIRRRSHHLAQSKTKEVGRVEGPPHTEEVGRVNVHLTTKKSGELKVHLTPKRSDELKVHLTTKRSDGLKVHLTPKRSGELKVHHTPKRSDELKVHLTPKRSDKLKVHLTTKRLDKLKIHLTPKRSDELNVYLTPKRSDELNVHLTPKRSDELKRTTECEQAFRDFKILGATTHSHQTPGK